MLNEADDCNKKDKVMDQFEKIMKVSERLGEKADQPKVVKK